MLVGWDRMGDQFAVAARRVCLFIYINASIFLSPFFRRPCRLSWRRRSHAAFSSKAARGCLTNARTGSGWRRGMRCAHTHLLGIRCPLACAFCIRQVRVPTACSSCTTSRPRQLRCCWLLQVRGFAERFRTRPGCQLSAGRRWVNVTDLPQADGLLRSWWVSVTRDLNGPDVLGGRG